MSGKKKRPQRTALARVTADPPDGILAQLIYKSSHLFGRNTYRAFWHEPVNDGFVMEFEDERAMKGAYLAVEEATSRIVGSVQDGFYRFAPGAAPSDSVVLRLFPMARA